MRLGGTFFTFYYLYHANCLQQKKQMTALSGEQSGAISVASVASFFICFIYQRHQDMFASLSRRGFTED